MIRSGNRRMRGSEGSGEGSGDIKVRNSACG